MIATKDSFEPHSSDQLPNSRRAYVHSIIHPDIRVPMREIELAPTKSFNGQIEVNEPVRLYDCSGPWSDPQFSGSVEQGLQPLRRDWVHRRGDVEEYEGRSVKPIDDGYLSENHHVHAAKRQDPTNFKLETRSLKPRRPLRALAGHPVTQLWYARQGIITPEMEFIAIRENQKEMRSAECGVRNSLHYRQPGSPIHDSTIQRFNDSTPSVFHRFPQRIPKQITP